MLCLFKANAFSNIHKNKTFSEVITLLHGWNNRYLRFVLSIDCNQIDAVQSLRIEITLRNLFLGAHMKKSNKYPSGKVCFTPQQTVHWNCNFSLDVVFLEFEENLFHPGFNIFFSALLLMLPCFVFKSFLPKATTNGIY